MRKEFERALAYIAKIDEIVPIPGYDRVEHARIKGWWVVVKKEEFKVGDKAVYFEVDSKVPASDERFAFLESKRYRIKTQRMCKVYSQGLALPVDMFPEVKNKGVGADVTRILNITYANEEDLLRKSSSDDEKFKAMEARRKNLFKKPLVKKIMKYELGRNIMFFFFGKKEDTKGGFPKWIVKTDEVRIENAPFYLESKEAWIKTEKLDGTSCTFAVEKGKEENYEFIVCSRNMRQATRTQTTYHESNIYWELADKYNIEKVLVRYAKKYDYAKVVLQGEGVGKVQGNPYKLEENKLFVFNLVVNEKRLGTMEMAQFCKNNGLTPVPIISTEYTLPKTMEELKQEADGYSVVNPKVKREGFVYRSQDGSKSFKNVSREYLLKHS